MVLHRRRADIELACTIERARRLSSLRRGVH